MPPKVIGPYRVLEVLGTGGVATVYRATDRRSGEVVASWSNLELTLQRVIWAFLQLNEEDGRLVTSKMDARPKVEWLRALAERGVDVRPVVARRVRLQRNRAGADLLRSLVQSL